MGIEISIPKDLIIEESVNFTAPYSKTTISIGDRAVPYYFISQVKNDYQLVDLENSLILEAKPYDSKIGWTTIKIPAGTAYQFSFLGPVQDYKIYKTIISNGNKMFVMMNAYTPYTEEYQEIVEGIKFIDLAE